MKKLKVLPLLAMVFVSFFMCIQSIYAATITESKYENNKISLSGTGNTQVQIVLFDLDNSPLYMTTANVENGKFNIVLPQIASMKNGDYTVKVADYDGQNVDVDIVSALIEQQAENDSNNNAFMDSDDISEGSYKDSIKTGDEELVYIYYICVILAVISETVLLILNVRTKYKIDTKMLKF